MLKNIILLFSCLTVEIAQSMEINLQKNLSDKLFDAIAKKDSNAIFKLICKGAQVNARNNKFYLSPFTPLEYAVSIKSPSIEVIKELLRCGADVNQSNYAGRTPLICALGNQTISSQIIITLLSAGAQVNIETRFNKNTPLILAMRHSKITPEIIEMFLQKGADVNATNILGNSALVEATQNPTISPRILQTLLQNGATVYIHQFLSSLFMQTLQNGNTLRMLLAEVVDAKPEEAKALLETITKQYCALPQMENNRSKKRKRNDISEMIDQKAIPSSLIQAKRPRNIFDLVQNRQIMGRFSKFGP